MTETPTEGDGEIYPLLGAAQFFLVRLFLFAKIPSKFLEGLFNDVLSLCLLANKKHKESDKQQNYFPHVCGQFEALRGGGAS